jgi:hypothetical protein
MKNLKLVLGAIILAALVFFFKQNLSDNFQSPSTNTDVLSGFKDPAAQYHFTRHAKCRMECRHISQEEVREIVQMAEVNYQKSDLDDSRGAKYALEGYTTKERQHVRVIVAPDNNSLAIVTVIDLDENWECPSCN